MPSTVLEVVAAYRPLTDAAQDVARARLGTLAILVEPDGRRGRGIIARALAQQPAMWRRSSGQFSPGRQSGGGDVLDEAEANTTRESLFASRERLLARIKRLGGARPVGSRRLRPMHRLWGSHRRGAAVRPPAGDAVCRVPGTS